MSDATPGAAVPPQTLGARYGRVNLLLLPYLFSCLVLASFGGPATRAEDELGSAIFLWMAGPVLLAIWSLGALAVAGIRGRPKRFGLLGLGFAALAALAAWPAMAFALWCGSMVPR